MNLGCRRKVHNRWAALRIYANQKLTTFVLLADISIQCPANNTNTQGKVGIVSTENITSWKACNKLCRNTVGCRYWTWHKETAGNYAYKCHTVKDAVDKSHDVNCISGSYDCLQICRSPKECAGGLSLIYHRKIKSLL